jgi:hypothetical protein
MKFELNEDEAMQHEGIEKVDLKEDEDVMGCGEFDKINPQLIRNCGDILFSNKIWLCDSCRKKSYTKEQKAIIERGNEL